MPGTVGSYRVPPCRSLLVAPPPDLAVEVRSPDDRLAALSAKAGDYLKAGASLMWIVDPSTRRVHVHQPARSPRVLQEDAALDGAGLLPGFSLPLAEVFAGLE
jgi:Uma2 family endonuclease